MKKLGLILMIVFSLVLLGCEEITKESHLEIKLREVLDKIPTSVESDLEFTKELDGCTFEWSTDNENIINNEGKVFRQSEHEPVKITVIGKYNEEELSKLKNVIVLKSDEKEPDNQDSELKDINTIINSEDGLYKTQGVIIAINSQSFLIKDETGMMLVYNGKTWMKDVEVGDIVKVTGNTSVYGKAKQFKEGSVYEKVGTENVDHGTPTELYSADLDAYGSSETITPKYVKVIGTLSRSGNYFNVSFEGASIIGSITYPLDLEDLSAYDGQTIEVNGYITGTSGSDKYLNIMSISYKEYIEEVDPSISSVSKVLSSASGEYKVSGTVVAVNKQSFLLKDSTGLILVYRGSAWVQDVFVGDKLIVSGVSTTYYNSVQFTTDATYEKVGETVVSYDNPISMNYYELLMVAMQDPMPIMFVKVEGTLTRSGAYYNIDFGGDIIGSIAYPFEENELTDLSGKRISVVGYITSLRSAYLSIMMTSYEDLTEVIVPDKDTFDLHVLEVNDIHGYCEQDEYNSNGISNMAYMINGIRNENPLDDVVLIGAGDMFQGTAISNITYGLTMINAMNAMKFDCMVVGNHEFDWGIEKVLNYFDNDLSNGEANFPLLNANIYKHSDNTLLTVDNGKVFESTIIEREDVKIGVIGYIGDVYTSINYVMAKDYYFDNDIAESVSSIGSDLKEQGVDIIVVTVHGGNSSSIENYYVNQSIANLKYDGEYLVDAVINGHTHTRQTGYINRYDGTTLPLVQGGGNGEAFGEIILNIDVETKDVVNATSKLNYVSSASSNYDKETEDVIQKALQDNYDVLNEVYSVAGETVSRKSDLYAWVGSVLLAGTGADIAICNTGGLRSTGDIIKGNNITISNLYMINPFDNYMMIVEVSGRNISNFLDGNAVFFSSKGSISSSSSLTYKVAVVDYVYYWDSFPQNDSAFNSNIIMRDLLTEDIKLNDTFKPVSNPDAKVGNLLEQKSQYNVSFRHFKDSFISYLNREEYL